MSSCGVFDPAPLLAIGRAVAFRDPGSFAGYGRGVHWAERYPQPEAKAIADALDLHPNTIRRYMNGGRLKSDAADRAAAHLGLHPANIWPEWFDG